jgi:cytochrome P450
MMHFITTSKLRELFFFFFLFAGYTIPAGWVVIVVPPAIHLNSDVYTNPFTFNPWRWEVILHLIYINSLQAKQGYAWLITINLY